MFEGLMAVGIALYVILTIHKKESPYEKYLSCKKYKERR